MAKERKELPSQSLRRAASQMEVSAIATPAGVGADQVVETQVSSPTRDAWRRFRRNWAAMISLTIIILLFVAAIFAPLLHTLDPLQQQYTALDLGPNPHHWLGTDGLGRDQYSRLLYGLRAPLISSVLGTVVTVILGALLGVISGYFGGIVDSILARFTDVMFAFPGFTLALIVVSLYGNVLDPVFSGAGRLLIIVLVFAMVGWPGLMRFVRSLALSMKQQQFMEAARTSGTSQRHMITRHLLPNMWGLILVQASFVVVGFVYTEAVLSIFGLGIEAPNPDLGHMLFEGTTSMGINYWEVLWPSATLTILILAFTFLGDGLRDAVDPRGRG